MAGVNKQNYEHKEQMAGRKGYSTSEKPKPCNPSIRESEASLVYREFQASLAYIMRLIYINSGQEGLQGPHLIIQHMKEKQLYILKYLLFYVYLPRCALGDQKGYWNLWNWSSR